MDVPGSTTWQPDVLLDAGGQIWDELVELIALQLASLTGGQVLEVVSSVGAVATALPLWCKGTGYELLGSAQDGEKTSFWIRKRGYADADVRSNGEIGTL